MADDGLSIKQEITLDLVEPEGPALSSTSDMPVIETKPDSVQAVPPSADDAEGEAEHQDESATSSTDEQSGQQAGKDVPRGVGKRLAALTKEREAAEARAKAAEERLDLALKALETREGKTPEQVATPQQDDGPPAKPNRNEYSDPDLYEEAFIEYSTQLALHTARQEVAKAQREEREAQARQAQEVALEQARTNYQQRVTKATEKYADFKEVAESPNVQISELMGTVIFQHDRGPEMAYFLGKNPEEAQRIMNLHPAQQLMEMGRVLARLDASDPPLVKSNAPKPIKPLTPGIGNVRKSAEDESMEEYAARRKQELGYAARK